LLAGRSTSPVRKATQVTNLGAVRARFARNAGLPFADVLTESKIRDVINDHGVEYRDRVFSPATTIWGFLSQVLSDDHSCRDAVSRVIAHRAASGAPACSPNTASYCTARSRLPAAVLRTLARRTAEGLQAAATDGTWYGRTVFVADGSHVSMPDTPANQTAYPQPPQQPPGLGFPLARIAVLLSLATGACHDLVAAPYAGKGTGETTLLRQMYGSLRPGDVVVADAVFDNYFLASELRDRGVDLVARRKYDRVGSRVVRRDPDGAVLVWRRPQKPRGMTGARYRAYPKSLRMRQVAVDARDKNNRADRFHVITTLLDPAVGGREIADLYERRWAGELDLRSIKVTLKMDILRCKTPDMVEKELWAHLLAYNLLRAVMAAAAAAAGIEPRAVSFKGAKQALTAFAPWLDAARPAERARLVEALLATVAYHRVGDRPGRWEPRARKRRSERCTRLTQRREIARLPKNRPKWH
jgi:hypothetical protein